MKLTVVLLYPDYMTDDNETFVETVEVEGELSNDGKKDRELLEHAVYLVRDLAAKAQAEPPDDPTDFAVLAVFAGDPEYLAGPLDDL